MNSLRLGSLSTIDTMPAVDDDYVLCVKLDDGSGNITYGPSSVITRDTTPPEIEKVKPHGGNRWIMIASI